MAVQSNLYAQWRARARPAALREGGTTPPPERLLQAIWFHQRVRRDQLRAGDGRVIRVLHPGFWNREAGPDFRGAVIQFGNDAPRSGDVEVDLTSSGWHEHGHDRDRNYEGVILHVVWSAAGAIKGPMQPTLAIGGLLDAPLAELDNWLGGDTADEWPPEVRGRCSAPLRELDKGALDELLQQAAHVRLQSKSAAFTARARVAGWERALWEGLFAALGYKNNVWPMRRLAELLPAPGAGIPGTTAFHWQARLFGMAGLLPSELPRKTGGDYTRRLWDIWWRERETWSAAVLPRTLWRFHGLRPANHPMRRLALAAHWLAGNRLADTLESWLRADLAAEDKPGALRDAFQVERDEHWSWHVTLNSPRSARPMALLGERRVTDLAINVVLPWFYARAESGRDAAPRRAIEQIYFAWPASEDNAVLKLARQRLLGARPAQRLKTAAAQQGLLQIVRDFCERSNATCEQCRFPDLVRQLRSG